MSSTHVFLTLVLASGCCMWTTHVSAIQFNFNFNFKQWMPMHSTTARPQPSQCKDLKDTCPEWVYFGYCDNPEYETYMTIYCNKSCNMCAEGNRVIQPRIVGGNVAARGAHPYMAALMVCTCLTCRCNSNRDFQHICGGTLIKRNWVLTAAHCLYGDPWYYTWSVLLGTNRLSRPREERGQRLIVEKIIYHPHFNGRGIRGDLALLKLKKAARRNPYVKVAQLVPPGYDVANKDCIAAGWGANKAGHDKIKPKGEPDRLREISMTNIPDSRCTFEKRPVDQFQHFCAVDEYFNGMPCDGDSGGPYMCEGYLAGVIEGGDKLCQGTDPTVFMRVSYFLNWISHTIKKN